MALILLPDFYIYGDAGTRLICMFIQIIFHSVNFCLQLDVGSLDLLPLLEFREGLNPDISHTHGLFFSVKGLVKTRCSFIIIF